MSCASKLVWQNSIEAISVLLAFFAENINPPGAETGIIQDNQLSTLSADALAPWVTKPSGTTGLTMQGKWVIVFHEQIFQLDEPSQFLKIIYVC